MKFSNALTTPKQKFFDNAEVSGLLNIFGYKGYSKKFDPEKFRPEKVVIATDADADGDHITFLLFTFFLRYLPFVIEQGKLYVANPPLFGVMIGKQKKFFANNIDYIDNDIHVDVDTDVDTGDGNGDETGSTGDGN